MPNPPVFVYRSTYHDRRILARSCIIIYFIARGCLDPESCNRSILLARPLFRDTSYAPRQSSRFPLRRRGIYIRGTMEREESIITGPAPVPCRRVSCNGRRSITQLTGED